MIWNCINNLGEAMITRWHILTGLSTGMSEHVAELIVSLYTEQGKCICTLRG